MALIDFIELRDDDIDIIELSSDEDTVQKDQIAAQHRAALLDRQGMFFPTAEGSQGVQAVFVAAGKGSQDVQAMFVATSEGSQDVQPVFVAASEGKQEAGEPGHALEATSSSMVMEKAPPVAGSEGSEDVQAVSVAAGEGGQEAGESGPALEATAPSMVMEKTTLVAASEGSQDVQAVLVAAGEGGQEAAESGHALEATTLSLVTETPPLDTAKSPYCHRSPTSAPLPSLTSTTPKAQTFEGGDAKSRRVKRKRRKKNYHTDTPRKSPRLIQMGECCASPVEEPAADHKRSRTLGPAEEAASEGRQEAAEPGHALGATSSSMVMEKAPPVAGSEGSQDVQAVSVAASEGREETAEFGHALEATASSMVMDKTTLVAASEGSQDVQVVLVGAGEGRQDAAESEHALEAITLSLVTETLPLDTAKSAYCHRSPTSAPLPSLTSTILKAQTSEGCDIKSVNVKAKRRKKNYHTNTPRKSHRLIQMGECCASPVEEPAADHKRSRMLGPAEEATASTDSAETVVLALPHAGSTNCLRSPTSATFPSLTSISTKVMTSEGGDAKLVSRRVKHPERNYHILSLVMEKPPLGTVVLALQHAESPNCPRPPTSAPILSLQLCVLSCKQSIKSPTSTSPKALSSEGGDTKLVSGKVKHRRKNCQPCKLTP